MMAPRLSNRKRKADGKKEDNSETCRQTDFTNGEPNHTNDVGIASGNSPSTSSTANRGGTKTRSHAKNEKLDTPEEADKENTEPFLKSERPICHIPAAFPSDLRSTNIVHGLFRHSTGQLGRMGLKQATIQTYGQQLSDFRVSHGASPFDRRVTALEWHPTHPTTLAVGSKGGDIMLWDYTKGQEGWNVVQGIGKGGVIHTLRFDRHDTEWIFTSSMDGMVSRLNFNGRPKKVYLNTDNLNFWYCSLDINYTDNVLVAGDNIGTTSLMSRQGEKLWAHRLHKQKVTHCEFNQHCPWLLATASTDRTIKVWDIRRISGKSDYVHQLAHEKPINSAYFSPDGTKLLTTDQYSELRIYSGPIWERQEQTIIHPHRFYQHLTPIKASWHPYQPLILVGRYPDESLPGFVHDDIRSIDVFDVNEGSLVCRLIDQCATGIQSLNVFSPSGDAIATGMGFNTLIWQNAETRAQEREERRETLRRQGREPPRGDEDRTTPQPRRPRSNSRKLTEKLKMLKDKKS